MTFGFESNLEDTTDYREGDYILVKFPGKKREHKYACIIQRMFENSEAKVVGMNYTDSSKTLFKTNDADVSVIRYDQILKKFLVSLFHGETLIRISHFIAE